jgi:putative oxidoreductase
MKDFFSYSKEFNKDLGILLLRAAVGVLMAFYGWHKFVHFSEEVSSDFWQTKVNLFGMTGEIPLALTIFAELICSIFLILGFLTRYSLFPLLFCMAFIVIRIDHWAIVEAGRNGPELNSAFFYLVIYVTLFITGPGRYSVDGFLKRRM